MVKDWSHLLCAPPSVRTLCFRSIFFVCLSLFRVAFLTFLFLVSTPPYMGLVLLY